MILLCLRHVNSVLLLGRRLLTPDFCYNIHDTGFQPDATVFRKPAIYYN
ncbi:hypothetical protein QHH11_08485 [Aphanizomenon sp. PH219]|nr:hypothetical protein [Aphanizomenon sp. PH219]